MSDSANLIRIVQQVEPDIYVKGGGYDIERLEETAVVRTWGGRALALPFVDGYPTTSLVVRIRSQP